jgi:hypothetical protein
MAFTLGIDYGTNSVRALFEFHAIRKNFSFTSWKTIPLVYPCQSALPDGSADRARSLRTSANALEFVPNLAVQ